MAEPGIHANVHDVYAPCITITRTAKQRENDVAALTVDGVDLMREVRTNRMIAIYAVIVSVVSGGLALVALLWR